MRSALAAIRRNPLYRFEVLHWGAIRPNSKRLLGLVLFTALLVGMWVRRYTYGITHSDEWIPFTIRNPSPSALEPILRFWLAEPRLLLGLCVIMIALEDAFRQRGSGWLDQVVLSAVSGREFLLAKAGSLVRWCFPWLAVVAILHTADNIALDFVGAHQPGIIGLLDSVLALLRTIELSLFIGLAAMLAWGAYLQRRGPFEMLVAAVWRVFRYALGAQLLYHLLVDFFSMWLKTNLEMGWLRNITGFEKVLPILVGEFPLTIALITAWAILLRQSLAQYGDNFQQLYRQDSDF